MSESRGTNRWPLAGRTSEDEAGVAMIVAVAISFIVLLLAILSFDIANSSIDRSGRHVRFETALHVAEHGVDQTLARVRKNRTYTTSHVLPTGLGVQQEEDWARAALAAMPAASLQRSAQGEFAVVKPIGRNILFAQGWIPNRAAPLQERLLRVEYLLSGYSPGNAILTKGSLTISGNAAVLGIAGHVHSNQDVAISGSPTIAGNLTAAGILDDAGGTKGTVLGTRSSGAGEQDVPPIRPRDLYDSLSASTSSWYDLCPDGFARSPGATPCTGTVLDTSGSFRGWELSGSGSSRKWQVSSNIGYDGVYYVYRSNAMINGNPGDSGTPWLATVITEKDNDESPCFQDYGDIEVSGNPVMRGYLDGLVLIAGRDLKVNGNANQSFQGFFGAQEQVNVSGNPNLVGAIVAEDRCHTPGSPVTKNEISGNMNLTYDGGMEVPLSGVARTTLWLEL